MENTHSKIFLYLKRAGFILLGVVVFLVFIASIQVVRNTSSELLSQKSEESIRFASYNVHYIRVNSETGSWSLADWEERKEPLGAAVGHLEADVIAFQEMESFAGGDREETENLARSYLLEKHPEYQAGAVGNPQDFPSTQPIFYRTAAFELEDQGWFFFSDTPDEIYSRTFNGSFPAFASWVELKERSTDESFRVVNIHVDFASKSNRLKSLRLIRERVAPWLESDERVFVVGDFNARLGSDTHTILKDASFTFAPVQGSTYHFNRGLNFFGAIDHFAYSPGVELAEKPVVVQRKFLDKWPTDHYPVVADFSLE